MCIFMRILYKNIRLEIQCIIFICKNIGCNPKVVILVAISVYCQKQVFSPRTLTHSLPNCYSSELTLSGAFLRVG